MSVENALLSHSIKPFQNIINFYKGLIIKNDLEGEDAETEITRRNYDNYINLSTRKSLGENVDVPVYKEVNPYYKIFTGQPRDDSEFINITIDDKDENDNNYMIYIHQVTDLDVNGRRKYPLGYSNLFVKGGIVNIIAQFPNHDYLNFIEEPLNAIEVRQLPQFSIV